MISSFKTEEEAIERANDTTYGLGSALFTENLTKAHRVARRIEAGMVWINSSNDSDYRIPFGKSFTRHFMEAVLILLFCKVVLSKVGSEGSSARKA